jgi:hypothetical protein
MTIVSSTPLPLPLLLSRSVVKVCLRRCNQLVSSNDDGARYINVTPTVKVTRRRPLHHRCRVSIAGLPFLYVLLARTLTLLAGLLSFEKV